MKTYSIISCDDRLDGDNLHSYVNDSLGHRSLIDHMFMSETLIHLVTGKHLKIDFDVVKRKFYSACNCVISNSHNTNELIQLQLQESYCLPILTYAAPAFNADVCVTKDLNVCWNSVYRRLFHFNRWESVKCCIKGLGRLNLVHILALQKLKFWYKLRHSSNRTVCNMSVSVYGKGVQYVACKLRMFCHR